MTIVFMKSFFSKLEDFLTISLKKKQPLIFLYDHSLKLNPMCDFCEITLSGSYLCVLQYKVVLSLSCLVEVYEVTGMFLWTSES